MTDSGQAGDPLRVNEVAAVASALEGGRFELIEGLKLVSAVAGKGTIVAMNTVAVGVIAAAFVLKLDLLGFRALQTEEFIAALAVSLVLFAITSSMRLYAYRVEVEYMRFETRLQEKAFDARIDAAVAAREAAERAAEAAGRSGVPKSGPPKLQDRDPV